VKPRAPLLAAALLVCVLVPELAGAEAEPGSGSGPIGLWWVEGGAAQVEIRDCGASLCGRVVWLRSPFGFDGCPLRDGENPDPALRKRRVLGLEMLRGLRPDTRRPGRWRGGEVYDPGSGSTYRASITQTQADRLSVRGYIGLELLGRTATWIRVLPNHHCDPVQACRVVPAEAS
jgi:uncharacterized protein (DUF2147 family)